jgi:pimeloyl-ACP methyl ester carboxylesterase
LVLLAPVLYPWDVDEPIITPAIEAKWAASGDFPVEDGASGKMVALHHDFLVELRRLEKTELPDNKPTLIVHGRRDEMVPYNHSLKFVSSNRSACLESLDDGHQLMAQPEFLLKTVVSFIGKCG